MSSSPYLHLLLSSCLLSLFSTVFAINCTAEQGSSLSTNQTSVWLSPNSEFAMGFHKLKSNDYLLAIWFYKIPYITVVWSANGKNPVSSNSTVRLTEDGKLLLSHHNGTVLWEAPTGGNKSICGALNDDGNFMLLDEKNNSIWQTFQNPTDTILPNQTLDMNTNLIARYSEDDYRDGLFRLSFQGDGNLVLYTLPEALPYWASNTVANATYKLIYDKQGDLYINDKDNNRISTLTTPNDDSSIDFYFLARIDSDGGFRQYRYLKKNKCETGWMILRSFPENPCLINARDTGSAYCGYNSYCQMIEDKATCQCPDGFSYRVPYDPRQGCKPNFELPTCMSDGWDAKPEQVNLRVYKNLDWPLSDYDLNSGEDVDLEKCKQLCLEDCFCSVAIHNGENCWKKTYPLSNGKMSEMVNRTALIKLPKNITDYRTAAIDDCIQKKDKQSTLVLILSVILGSSVFVNLLFMFVLCLGIFLYNKGLLNFLSGPTSVSAGTVRSYTYKELEEATGGFKQILGKGASGKVYKGVLKSDPKRFVAVKKLENLEPGDKEFRTEVNVIGQTHHKNLVRLLGFCDEREHQLLIYEYMSNGSLATFLFGITRPDWNQRVKISIGIARGLMYLHEECSSQIIHCDIKPQNILLDEFMTPKISDFGLAKLLLAEQSRVARTHKRGTIGYFAPEWFRKASITVKVDVYSFGVVLLEMICCKSSVQFGMGDEEIALMDWVYDCYCKKKLEKLVENDEEARNDMKSVERLVMVAIWCIQEDPSLRPPMKKVTQMLEGSIHVSVPPRPSTYSLSLSIHA